MPYSPVWRRVAAWLLDNFILFFTGWLIYRSGLELVFHFGFPEKFAAFLLYLFLLLTPFYFYRWKKVSATPGLRLLRMVVADENLITTISGDRALLRSLLAVPVLPALFLMEIFPHEKQLLVQNPWQSKILIGFLIWGAFNLLVAFRNPKRQTIYDLLFHSVVILPGKAQIYESKKESVGFSYIILTLFSLFSIYPILRVVSISLRPGDRLLSKSLAIIPGNASLQTYYQLFFEQPFLRWLFNSLVISAGVTLVGVGLAATAGYAFSRYKFRGRDAAMIGLITTQMFPATMLLLPLFIMLIKLGAYDSYIGLIIAYSATALPFTVWQMKGYYDTIPYSLEEAASIDGCSQFAIFWRIILPLATPALAITALFSFMTAWSEYLVAAVLIQDKNLFTLPLGLKLFQSAMQTSWGLYSAGAVVVSIPVVLIFLVLSRWLVSGLTLGSVKG